MSFNIHPLFNRQVATIDSGKVFPKFPSGGISLPTTTNWGEYLYSDGTQFVVGGPSISLGIDSGQNTQSSFALALGYQAGQQSQQTYGVALGYQAGQNFQSTNNIAIGYQAGQYTQGFYSYIDPNDPNNDYTLGSTAIAIGNSAGQVNQLGIAIGNDAGQNVQYIDGIAIGTNAGQNNQGGIAIGTNAGQINQGGIAIGFNAGNLNQNGIAIGGNAGRLNQDYNCIAIGLSAGENKQYPNCIAIGPSTGGNIQYDSALAIGNFSGGNKQGTYGIAIGANSAGENQHNEAIAIGQGAGYYRQGTYAIAIGSTAGRVDQGTYSIAIGYNAGFTQPANSVVISASGNYINGVANGCCIAPLNTTGFSGGATASLMLYNSTTKEILYNNSKTFIIDHPNNPDKYLVHACLEGPEVGVYYRGIGEITNNRYVDIFLPEYTNKFTDFTINIVGFDEFDEFPENIDELRIYNTTNVKNSKFRVYSNSNGKFYWTVFAKRETNMDVEPNKSDVNVKGDGPYKFISLN